MDKKELLKRKEQVERLAEQGYQFESYSPHLPEAEVDHSLAMHYKLRDLILDFKEARVELNLTQEDIARKSGTKQAAVSRFESYRAIPTLPFLVKYAQALGKDFNMRLSDDFTAELPTDLREKASKLFTSLGMNIKQTLTEGLAEFVHRMWDRDLEIVATLKSPQEEYPVSYSVDISSLVAQK